MRSVDRARSNGLSLALASTAADRAKPVSSVALTTTTLVVRWLPALPAPPGNASRERSTDSFSGAVSGMAPAGTGPVAARSMAAM